VNPDAIATRRAAEENEELRGKNSEGYLTWKADAQVLGKQLLRCGTSVAANYRAACRVRSRAEWIAKVGLVVEEADETVFWLEMLQECGIVKPKKLELLMAEAQELTALFTASQRTSRGAGR
jgi:four helix bundle protein